MFGNVLVLVAGLNDGVVAEKKRKKTRWPLNNAENGCVGVFWIFADESRNRSKGE